MPLYNYSNTAAPTTITGAINSSATSWSIAAATGLPAVPFKMVLEPGTANQEIVVVGARTGTALSSITRGADGSTEVSHSSGVIIAHEVTAEDFSTTNAQTGYVMAYMASDMNIASANTGGNVALTIDSAVSDAGWTIASSYQLTPPANVSGKWKMTVAAQRTYAGATVRWIDGRATSSSGTWRVASATSLGQAGQETWLYTESVPFTIDSSIQYLNLFAYAGAIASPAFYARLWNAAPGITTGLTPAVATYIELKRVR